MSDIRIEKDDLEKEVELLQQQHEKLKSTLNQKQFSRTKKELNPITFENINDSANRTHYNRRIETKNILEYIHGGLSGAFFGAWDFILGYGDETLIKKFIFSYRRGKFIEKLYGKFIDKHFHSEDSMKRALAMKYQTFMSRRKFEFIYKIQKRSFGIETQEWRKNSITYGVYNLNLKTASVSNKSVELFVRSLDIGDVSIIPGISGVSRTITGLTTLRPLAVKGSFIITEQSETQMRDALDIG